ncbi:MAG: alpha-glucosidase/alpha-galactosidase [Oscillospiraceae bacterium]|nr:alpha-glucosidase/alpha-galactosidase [Oscillospiraceae bacterium]
MFKVAFIGAGSIGFTRNLLRDLLSVPEFHNIEVAFTDINQDYLDMVTHLCQQDIAHNGLNINITKTLNRREAFAGAKYVINCIRQGLLEAFETDVKIPLKYGVDQCVGDTLCAGGIMYGQRTVIELLGICADIREVAEPGCLLLNYSNPNAMVTWACNQFGGVNTIGLCHGVQAGGRLIAEAYDIPADEIDYTCAGINHQTWYIAAQHKGRDLLPGLLAAFEAHERISRCEKVRIDVLRHFGYFSTESNGHLSEYLPWYRKRPDELAKWIDLSDWHHGETGGYLRQCTENRNWFEQDFPNCHTWPRREFEQDQRSCEHGSYIIESLETGRVYRGHFNVVNGSTITNLPSDCVVEVPGYVDANGVHIPHVGELPWGCAAICNASVNVQRLAVLAAVHGDATLLKQAMMLDPLVSAVCNTEEVCRMTDEMLVAGEKWLPQYKDVIAELIAE